MVFSPVSISYSLSRLTSSVPAVFGVCFRLPLFGVPSSSIDLSFCSASSAVSGCLYGPFPSACSFRIYGYLSVGAARSDEFLVLPGISLAFCFVGFVFFLRFQLAWFSSFFCSLLFSIFLRSFLFGVPFSFLWFSLISFPQGPPLGGCVLLLGFWLVCPTLVSLAMSHRATVLQAVSSEDFLLCLFFFLPSLLWPGLRQ